VSHDAPIRRLYGRRHERDVLGGLLTSARTGQGQVLVLRGEPGIGKSAMLDFLTEQAADFRVARTVGVESAMELSFAGLHLLCSTMLDRIARLPAPQRDALTVAFGMNSGPPPDRFMVGLAVLTLLDDVAGHQPLLCVIDDAQWLDDASVQTLAFVARRLLAEHIALVFAARRTVDRRELAGLPELVVTGLNDADARTLLRESLRIPLDDAVLDQLVAECAGNPLALLELPRAWESSDLAGGFAVPDAAPVSTRIEDSFVRRLQTLPISTRQLVLTAAADPSGDLGVLWQALASAGIDANAVEPAEAAGLITVDTRLRFRHPLVRSMAYGAASVDDRRAAHRALAAATDPTRDPDRRAWHCAQATAGPDDDVAADLEVCADRAQARGGLAAAAAFLEKAMELTPDPARRARRALAAAQVKARAGLGEAAASLLAAAEAGPINALERAHADLLRGQLAFVSSHGLDAPALLVDAARQFRIIDPALARDTFLDALAAALFVGRFGDEAAVAVAGAVRTATVASDTPTGLLLGALTDTVLDGYATGAPALQRAVAAFRTGSVSVPEAIRWLWLAAHAAHDLWDDECWQALSETHIGLARQIGALHILPLALSSRAGLHLFAGEFGPASSLVEEVASVTAATGNQLPPYGALALAAYRGDEVEATTLIEAALSDVAIRGEGMGLTLIQHAQAVLYNGLGQFEKAFAAAQQGAAHPSELAFSNWCLVQLVEAAERSGRHSEAIEAVERLSTITRACGTDWALGVEARSRALVVEGEAADSLYREALERIARTRLPLELARARLLYGEWLRRGDRQREAREQLRAAHDALVTMGAVAYASRARKELAATGERVRTSKPERAEVLTAQEAQIARLAVSGRTNPEIGAELFLSPRTVEWHLRKVFAKLDVSSRRQLRNTWVATDLAGAMPAP
jgi:DNA-binding CsgD family transcriptional regulator